MSLLSLKRTYRLDKNTVGVVYLHEAYQEQFIVEWSNIHPGTGEVCDYDLQIDCLCDNSLLKFTVEDAIIAGESDANDHLDLYLEIRDTVSQLDVRDI